MTSASPATPSPSAEPRSPGPVGTLARGMAILDLLLQATQPMSLAEIGDALGLDHSTALRLLRSLEEMGRIIRMPDGRKYACSPASLRPLAPQHPLEQFRREAAPLIAALAARLRQSVVLCIFMGLERLVVDVALTSGSLSPYYTNWLHGPLHGSGPGKCLLMSVDAPRRRALLGPEPYRAHTSATLTTLAAVEADLAVAAGRGYAVVRDEYYDGLSAVAAPFSSWSGKALGCIAVTGHSQAMTDEMIETSGPEIARVARLIPLQASSLQLLEPFAV